MAERKFNLTLGALVDMLTINQLKQVMIPAKRAEITEEIDNMVSDINSLLLQKKESITAEWIRDIIILAQYNTHIWYNEKNWRDGIREGNNLELTHGLNSIRNQSKNRIQSIIDWKREHKIDNVEAFPEWVPSGY